MTGAGAGSFRQRMSGLHTWCGLTCGWLLCAIFLAGSLAVFREPLTRWMQATPVVEATGPATDVALAAALGYLGRHAAQARAWNLTLPTEPGGALLLSWRDAGGRAMQAAVDPADGRLLPRPWGRETEGGRHFMTFHYMLHAGMTGFWIVGWIGMCALVALVSGVVVHKRIFKDFFTFRPGKGQRSWLDAHNAGAVLALPFLLMIVYTGLAYFYGSYVPLPVRATYGPGDGMYQAFDADLKVTPAGATGAVIDTGPVALPDIGWLHAQAVALTGDAVQRIFIQRPGKPDMVIRMMGEKPDGARTGTIHADAGLLVFEQAGPHIASVVRAGAPDHFAAPHVHPVLEQLHVGGFGGWGIRWLYFLSGLIGTAMIATGLILFSVKRRQKSLMEFGRFTPQVYRAVDVLNMAAITGACVASIGFLYANRLIPAGMAGRTQWEIRAYFLIWAATLLHAALRPRAAAWREQVLALALLCLALPLLNWITTGQQLAAYLLQHDGQRAGVELTAVAIGLCALWLWRRLRMASVPLSLSGGAGLAKAAGGRR